MKFLFVINQFYKGGAEISLLNLLKRIKADGVHEIDFIVLNQCPIENAVSLIEKVPSEIHVLDIYKMQQHISIFNRIRAHFLLTAEEKRCDPSIALLYVREKEYDWAFHIGEWWSPAFVALKVRAKRKALWIHSDLTKAVTFNPDVFFAYDEKIANYIFVSKTSMNSCMEEFPFIKKKATCIYNISDVPQIKKLAEEPVTEDYFNRGLPVVVTCANIRKEKNHKRQLRVMSILKDRGVNFIWLNIGNTSDKARCDELLAEADALGLKNRFILTGAKDNPYKYMARADAVTVLSDYESWSLVITEAKILGIPVIATKTSGASEQLIDGKTGILTEFNVIDISEKIEQFLCPTEADPDIRKNISNFDNTSEIIDSFFEMVKESSSGGSGHKQEILYVIDDINYQGGAHIATKLQIQEFLKRGHSISIFSSSIPTAKIRAELNGVTFLSWKDFLEDRLYNRRLLDCLFDVQLTKEEKEYKASLTWEGRVCRNPNIFEDMVFPRLSQMFTGYETICVMGENSGFRTVVANAACKNKVQWIHIDYCQWKDQTAWTRKITQNDGELYRSFDKIVVLTASIRQSFVKLYPHLEPKVVINANLMPVDEILEKAKEDLKKYISFVTVGRIDAQKAYERLYEVLEQLYTDGYRFYWTIIGDGNEFHHIQSLFMQSKLRQYVTLTGSLSNPFPYIKGADVFALLSQYEGLPNTIFEELILGTPVIATNVGGVSTQIMEEQTGWLVDNNEESIYQGLKYILDHPEEIKQFRENLKAYRYDNASILKTAEMVLCGE